jgi:hypothetical protein
MKNDSLQFICGKCAMTHKNPMKNKDAIKRQTNEEIVVICPDDRHQGDKTRKMKMSGYFGSLEQPYAQTCKSCAQLDKVISEEQKKKMLELWEQELKDEQERLEKAQRVLGKPPQRACTRVMRRDSVSAAASLARAAAAVTASSSRMSGSVASALLAAMSSRAASASWHLRSRRATSERGGAPSGRTRCATAATQW